MSQIFKKTINKHFSSLTDPRVQGRIDHKLLDILTITICAVICGANDFIQIEKYGKSKEQWLRTFLELPNGIPSHDTLHKDVKLMFSKLDNVPEDPLAVDTHKTVDGEHGRVEVRRYKIISDTDWLFGKQEWKNMNSIGMVKSERHIGDKIKTDTRYYITSLGFDAKKFGEAVRQHWGVENSLHWVLDISFREDESRIRKGNAAENMATIRHIALNMLNNEKIAKVGTKTKRLMAAWNNDYLFKIISEKI